MAAHKVFIPLGIFAAAMLLRPAFAGEDAGNTIEKLALQENLRKEISCDFDETPLPQVLDFFRTTLSVNIVNGLGRSETEDRLITLRLTDVSAERALRAALRQVKLRYGFAYGAIYVSTPEGVAATEPRYLKSYDVSDLLFLDESETDQADQNNGGSGKSTGDAGQELLNIIIMLTGPQHWDYVGSSRSSGGENDSAG